jgi:hypothetical protein
MRILYPTKVPEELQIKVNEKIRAPLLQMKFHNEKFSYL